MSKKMRNKIKTEWDLSLLYKSVDDPQIEIDLLKAEKAYTAFAKKYSKRTDYLKNESVLLNALKDYEDLIKFKLGKPLSYLSKKQSLDSRDHKVGSLSNLLSQKISKISNHVIFFEINISKIQKNIQKKFLSSKKLGNYRYFLCRLFESGKFTLTASEEKILTLKSLTSYDMWVDFLSKTRSSQVVIHNGKEIPISTAGSIIQTLPSQEERLELYSKIVEKNLAIADIAKNELTAVVTNKKINDDLRGYKNPYESTVLGYQNKEETVISLVNTVTDNFSVIHKFFKLKAKMLGLKKLKYPDRFAFVGKTSKKITFEESYSILLRVFSSLDLEFGNILKRFVENGQIDVFPKVGKRGGAFCDPSIGLPTYIFLNHTDTLNSLTTFAHEMGHGIHSELSKSQPIMYEDYPISSAEVASTLFEAFVFYDQFEKLSDDEKIVALHDKISDDAGTIFAQIAFFNFELEMHKTVREKGAMSKDELAGCFSRHVKSFLGPVMDLEKKDGFGFVAVPHFRYFFYVYTYAMGQIISKALYKKYSEDKTYIEKIKQFLSAGGSMSPEDIFKSIGVDVRKHDFWKLGIKSIEEDIDLLEKLVKRQQKR